MSRNPEADYTQYVHEFVDDYGATRYAVGKWNAASGQYTCKMDSHEKKLTGASFHCAKTPKGLGGYQTRAQALRRARYLYGKQLYRPAW